MINLLSIPRPHWLLRTRALGWFSVGLTAMLLASLGRADAPPGHYTVTAETVTDTKTGLVWQREVDPMARSFDEAIAYCTALTLGGQGGWRVPSLTELQTLVDESRTEPAIDLTAFPEAPSDYVWTSSLYTPDLSHGWTVRFNDGYTWHYPVATPYPVRCVR